MQRVRFVARHLIVALQPPRKDHLVVAVCAVHQHLLAEDGKVLTAVLTGRDLSLVKSHRLPFLDR